MIKGGSSTYTSERRVEENTSIRLGRDDGSSKSKDSSRDELHGSECWEEEIRRYRGGRWEILVLRNLKMVVSTTSLSKYRMWYEVHSEREIRRRIVKKEIHRARAKQTQYRDSKFDQIPTESLGLYFTLWTHLVRIALSEWIEKCAQGNFGRMVSPIICGRNICTLTEQSSHKGGVLVRFNYARQENKNRIYYTHSMNNAHVLWWFCWAENREGNQNTHTHFIICVRQKLKALAHKLIW